MALISSDADFTLVEYQQAPHLRHKKKTNEVISASSYSQDAGVWLGHTSGRRGCTPTSCRRVVQAPLASAVAIVMLIFLCSLTQRDKRRSVLLTHRKLSDDDELHHEEFIHCTETGEETDSASSSSESPLSVSSEDEAEIITLSSDTASSDGDPSPPPPPPPPEEAEPGPSAKKPRLEPMPGTGSEGPPGEPPTQPPLASGPLEGRSEAEIAAARALVELHPRPSVIQLAPPLGGGPQPQMQQGPQGEGAPSAAPGGPQDTASSPPPIATSSGGPEAVAVAAEEVGAAEVSSDPGEGPSRALPPGQHPFARLPKLQAGVAVRNFDPQRAASNETAGEKALPILSRMQVLLSQETLDAKDAAMLLDLVEQTVAHCMYYQRADVSLSKHYFAAETLAMRFLLLEAATAGLQVLGQKAPDYTWRQLAQAMPHEYVSGKPTKRLTFMEAARKLSKAVERLKTGVRPSDDEIVQMKMMIFCDEPKMQRYQAPAFAAWRKMCP